VAWPTGAVPGIDVSHYQAVIDWPTVQSAGVAFGFAKASEGESSSDLYFVDNWSGMKAAGILRGAYHFFHPARDPQAQVNCFLQQLAKANGDSVVLAAGDLPAALDIEVTDGIAVPAVMAGAMAWLMAVEAATERRPIVYTYTNFWNNTLGNPSDLSGYPLWISYLNVTTPILPSAWPNWIFWQFAQQPLTGVPSVSVDLDVFNGTEPELQTIAGYA